MICLTRFALRIKRCLIIKENTLLRPLADALSTHPPSKERVAQMQSMESKVAVQKNAVVSSSQFERMQTIIKQKYS